MTLFSVGRLVSTPGALEVMERCNVSPWYLIERHSNGDWGCVSKDDAESNDRSVKDDTRILSAYMVGEEKVWVITESDRSSTCILLPSEY